MKIRRSLLVTFLAATTATACFSQKEAAPAAAPETASAGESPADDAPIPPTASPYDALPEGVRAVMDKPFTGDFDELVKRRAIRAAVTFNRTHYFLDQGQERGLAFESLKQFENDLNADLKTGNLKVHVVIVPMSRDQLYPALTSGKVDMVAAMVTVTPEREKLVAFSAPTRSNPAISTTSSTRKTPRPMASAGRFRPWSSCSGNTGRNTMSTTC